MNRPDRTDRGAADLALVRLLQLTDSAFPSGAYTLSHGLETLVADRVVADESDLRDVIRVHLLARLAWSDLVVVGAAHAVAKAAAGDSGARITAMDRRLTASKLAADDRRASERVGLRLATEVERFAPSVALGAFLNAIREGRSPGNAAVSFGLAGATLGAGRRETMLAAASSSVSGLVSAGVRLGVIGHGAAQRLVSAAAQDIVAAVDRAEALDPHDLRPSAPQLEVALARHETADVRLFVS